MKEKTKIDRTDLERIKDRELKYSQLCRELKMSTKTGGAKSNQLADLDMYCRLERLLSPTRYAVREIYDVELVQALNGNSKYQAVFEAAMYQALLANGTQQLYVSNMELLELFKEVNENFRLACNKDAMAEMGETYAHFADMGQIAYKILKRWTQRRLKVMEIRGVIIVRRGYRLYSETPDGYILTTNVIADSDKEKLCQEIYNQVVREVMPKGWGGEWVGLTTWLKFERRIKELTAYHTHGQYTDLKSIYIISPPQEQFIRERLDELYSATPELQVINNESCRKILETTQLDKFTTVERKRLVDISVKQNPKLKLRQLLNKEDEN